MSPEPSPVSRSFRPFLSPTPLPPGRHKFHCRFHPTALTRITTLTSSPQQEAAAAPHARQPFDQMPDDVASWSFLILATTRRGDFSQSLALFAQMSKTGWTPDEFALGSLLKASSGLADTSVGQQLHAKSLRSGLTSRPRVRTSLIAMYSACGLLADARRVFDEVPPLLEGDIPSWNSIISAYALHRRYRECFMLFSAMLKVGHLCPTDATYSILIGACTLRGDDEIGRIIHGMVIKDGAFDKTKMLNCLITLYAKCGDLEGANKVFSAVNGMNVVSWNSILAGHEQNGECEIAVSLFRRMTRLEQQVKPNRITFLSVLSAISAVFELKLGREVHARMIRSGLEHETSIANSLITMYVKCGDVSKGRLVFKRMAIRDVITWNSMLTGYSQNGQSENCYELFREMQSFGIKPDDHTLTILLGAFSSDKIMSDYSKLGREVHGYLLRRTEREVRHVSPYNAILTMYSRSNRISDAEKLFKGMSERDSFSWNAMMDGYSASGCCEEAIMLFVDMHEQGLQSNHLTFSILLTACGRLVSVGLGKQFHALILKHQIHGQFAQTYVLSISNALVSMYSKCGDISDAEKLFQRMARRDVLSWTAIITGYAHHGMACKSLYFFERMKRHGVRPNSITFLGLLTACAHVGLVDEGTQYFNSMSRECGVEPDIEHYACMVDLFSRSGQFERAQAMVEDGIFRLGLKSRLCLWKVLLGGCHAHKQLELGVQVATRILESDPDDETAHVLLSNLYAAFGLWKDAIAVRRMMRDRGLKKEAGCSWVEVKNRRHVFVAGDGCHPYRKEIYEKLKELDGRCRAIGYVPITECVLHDVDEVQKEAILSSHSERLAVSFAILQGTGKGVLRVIKNLRVCGDCHSWMKFTSKVEGREIVLRDSRRFHSFTDGRCSCGDYW